MQQLAKSSKQGSPLVPTTATSTSKVARAVPKRYVAARALDEGKLASVVGERLGRWLASPYDLLSFPVRAGTGALVSIPERLSSAQADLQRLVELVQDPRPVVEKQDVLRKELEDTMLEFLEKGTVIEQDVLTNVKSILPLEAANALTELIPDPPNKVPQTGPVVPVEEEDITVHTYAATATPTTTTATSAPLTTVITPTVTTVRPDLPLRAA